MTNEKLNDAIAVVGVISAIALPVLVLTTIWVTTYTMVRVTLTDILILGICYFLSD